MKRNSKWREGVQPNWNLVSKSINTRFLKYQIAGRERKQKKKKSESIMCRQGTKMDAQWELDQTCIGIVLRNSNGNIVGA